MCTNVKVSETTKTLCPQCAYTYGNAIGIVDL